MSDTRFRVILPTSKKRSPPPPPIPRRTRVSSACDACRTRKIKCNGGTPCITCQRNDSICIYPSVDDAKKPTVLRRENRALREQITAHQEILHHLQAMPPSIAQQILQHLQATSDPVHLLETIKNLSSSSPSTTEQSPSPRPCAAATNSDCPIAIPPIEVYESGQPTKTTLPSFQEVFSSCIPPCESSSKNCHLATLEPTLSPKSLPEPQYKYCDPQLAKVDIAIWTTVPISNVQAASVLSSFLELDHPVGSVFKSICESSSLLVWDMIDLQSEYCSELMVNALLAYASQGNEFLGIEAERFGCAFEKEAIKEARTISEDSLPTIIGLALLFMAISKHEEESECMAYLEEAVEMARRMEVSGTQEGARMTRRKSPDSTRTANETAWRLCRMIV